MKILVIYSQKNSATLRTRETITEATLENVEALGHKMVKREDVLDRLVDRTYLSTFKAWKAATRAGFEVMTSQKIAQLCAHRR